MKFRRITKAQAKKLFAKGEKFYMIPCNFYPGGFWHTECLVDSNAHLADDRVTYGHYSPFQCSDNYLPNWDNWVNNVNNEFPYTPDEINRAFVNMYNNWAYYNTNYEMGYYAHYYVNC